MNQPQTLAASRAAVMIAFSEGRKVQWRRKGDHDWNDGDDPSWDWTVYHFRVKPEEAAPRTAILKRCDASIRIVDTTGSFPEGETITFTELPPGWEVKRIQ